MTDVSGEPADAEHDDDQGIEAEAAAVRGERGGFEGSRGEIDPDTLIAMRPHIVNLRAGLFSDEGVATTTPGDVDAIFDEHLQRELGALEPAGKLRILLFAHGGLVSESDGLAIVRKHLDWWRANGVYPIYFVWETGLFETLAQLLDRSRRRGAAARDLADFTSDPAIEFLARNLGGQRIWGGMKWSAERAAGTRRRRAAMWPRSWPSSARRTRTGSSCTPSGTAPDRFSMPISCRC